MNTAQNTTSVIQVPFRGSFYKFPRILVSAITVDEVLPSLEGGVTGSSTGQEKIIIFSWQVYCQTNLTSFNHKFNFSKSQYVCAKLVCFSSCLYFSVEKNSINLRDGPLFFWRGEWEILKKTVCRAWKDKINCLQTQSA